MKISGLKKLIAEIIFEETFDSKNLVGPYTVHVKSGRLAGQTVMANRDKTTGIYYYLNPDIGKDEPIGDEKSVDIQKPKAEEGVGYVYDKDMKKDPKHISGKRWTIKFQSSGDLGKHGNTEKSPISETITKNEIKSVIKDLINEMWKS